MQVRFCQSLVGLSCKVFQHKTMSTSRTPMLQMQRFSISVFPSKLAQPNVEH